MEATPVVLVMTVGFSVIREGMPQAFSPRESTATDTLPDGSHPPRCKGGAKAGRTS